MISSGVRSPAFSAFCAASRLQARAKRTQTVAAAWIFRQKLVKCCRPIILLMGCGEEFCRSRLLFGKKDRWLTLWWYLRRNRLTLEHSEFCCSFTPEALLPAWLAMEMQPQ